MKSIKDIDIFKKRVFIRVDFNVPMNDQRKITDDTKIQATFPTIEYAFSQKARVILASHLGRPKGKEEQFSLRPIAERLSELLKKPIKMATDSIGFEVEKEVEKLKEGDVLLLENLRFYSEEQKGDDGYAKSLARLCDVYVNDAFAVSHRADASVSAITKYVPMSVAGLLLKKELNYLKKALANPVRPLVAIVGGAKVSTKLGVLQNLLSVVDILLVGGAMANTFLKSQGILVGKSKVEENLIADAADVLKRAIKKNVQVCLPLDVVVASELSETVPMQVVSVKNVPADQMILDIGPNTVSAFAAVIEKAKTVVWNGPMGVFETPSFSKGTMELAKVVGCSEALSIVGGGDTSLAIHKSGQADHVSYISTGGGAFLELLEGKTLPAIAALEATGR